MGAREGDTDGAGRVWRAAGEAEGGVGCGTEEVKFGCGEGCGVRTGEYVVHAGEATDR